MLSNTQPRKGIARYFQSDLLLSFTVALLCFALTYLFFGFYYSEYEGLVDSFFSGKLTPGMPFKSIYFLGNIGTSQVYSWLYTKFPDVEWISWILYGYLFLSCVTGLYLVAKLLPARTPTTGKILLMLVIYFLVFADHNIHFIYTRVSYINCGLSLIAIIVLFDSVEAIKLRPWLFIGLNVFFTLGTLTRVESATATVALLVFFALFYLQNIRQLIRLFLYPLLLVGTMVVGISLDIKSATDFYKQVEPDIEVQFCERENAVPLSDMKTLRDTVLYRAATAVMWSDPRVLTPTYLRSLIKPEHFIFTDSYQWQRTIRDVSTTLGQHKILIILCLLLAFTLALQYNFGASVWQRLWWLAFELSFWALIVAQTYTFKIVDRSFLPFMGLFIFCHVVLLLKNPAKCLSVWSVFLMGLSGVLFIAYLFQLKHDARVAESDLKDYRINTQKIKEVAANDYLVLNSSSCDFLFLSNTPFHPFNYSAFKRVYITDGYNIPFLPYYRRFLEADCHCNMYAYPGFWNYLQSVKSNVFIYSEPSRIAITCDYLKEIHHYILPIEEDTSVTLLQTERGERHGAFQNLKIYRLR